MDFSDIPLLIGFACAVGAFFWLCGLMVGIKLRGRPIPMRAACGIVVIIYLVVLAALGAILLWKSSPKELDGIGYPTEETLALPVVSRVIDGDTIEVEGSRVRILGIDTPEVGECYYEEASEYARIMLEDNHVMLVADATQGDKDKYGRLLRYVDFTSEEDAGLALIAQGFAREYTYDAPYERQAAYQAAEEAARAKGRGLWSACE